MNASHARLGGHWIQAIDQASRPRDPLLIPGPLVYVLFDVGTLAAAFRMLVTA